MVKKGSFFKRIFGLGAAEEPAAGARAGDAQRAKPGAATATVEKSPAAAKPGVKPPAADRPADQPAGAQAPDPVKKPQVRPVILESGEAAGKKAETLEVITEKLTQQEEASIKINQGLKGLSSLLTDIDDRLKEQSRTSTELVTTVRTIPEMLKDLPESSRAGIELLNAIQQILEHQNRGVADLNGKVAVFSESVSDISVHLERDAQRRAEDADVFKRSIGEVKATVTGISEQQSRVNQEHSSHIKDIAAALKKSHELQQERVETIISRMKVMNGLVIFLILVIIAGLVAVVLSLT